MNATYGVVAGLPQACRDIGQPIAELLALAGAALAEEGLPENAGTRMQRTVRLAEWHADRDRALATGLSVQPAERPSLLTRQSARLHCRTEQLMPQ